MTSHGDNEVCVRGEPRLRRVLPAILLAMLCAGSALAQIDADAAEVQAEMRLVPGDVLGRDEIATLEIKITTQGNQLPAIPDPIFELENFRIVGGPSQSTGLTILNGRPSASRALSWQLLPRKLGKARVHSGSVTIEGQKIRLRNQEVEVVENPPPRRRTSRDPLDRFFSNDPFSDSPRRRRSRRAPEAPKILLKAEVSPRRPYVGEQVIYTLSLYTQADINPVNPENFPDFKGFWVQVIPQPDQLRPQMVDLDGERFGKVILIQRALFPRRAGAFEVEEVRARMVARIPDNGPFGSLMPRRREIVRTSNPVTIEVRELPSPEPPGFQGAVGDLRLSAELAPSTLEVGDAATLTLTLEGEGHLQGIAAPEIPELPGVEVFPPQQQSSEELRGRTIIGRRVWSFVLMPERAGTWELPGITVPFFDPRTETYRDAATSPFPLIVRGSTSATAGGGADVELHPIRTAALPAVDDGARGFAAALPWLFVLPWALALGLWALRRRGDGGGAGAARRHLLHRLDEAAHEERARPAAALIEDAWRDFLSERYEVPPGTPSPRWSELLRQHGVKPDTADALVAFADDLHYLRYAPKLSSVDELRGELLERSRKLAKEVG